MQIMLLLTAEQASMVRGASEIDPDSFLDPIPLPDGRYALTASVLDGPIHQAYREMLSRMTWTSLEFGEDDLITRVNSQDRSMHEGHRRHPRRPTDLQSRLTAE